MGFNIMSLFVEQPASDNKESNTAPAVNAQVQPATPASTAPTSIPTVSTPSAPANVQVSATTVNQDILDKLCAHMENCNLPGPDYMELKKAANSEGMLVIPDESVRFQAAFATLKSMHPNFTKDIVLNSIDAYIKELRKQNEVAKSQIEAKRKSEVEDKKLEIAEKEKRIAELQQEIVNISTEVSSMKETVAATDAECDKNISEFEYAVNLIVGNLETDKAKISEKLVG